MTKSKKSSTRRKEQTKTGEVFRTRNYKHEVTFDAASPRCVANYTDHAWHTLCREVAGLGFTGLVLYGSTHPFEYILDYREFPHAATQPPKLRDAIRGSLVRGLAIAHQYGLTTFIQHYVTEFTDALAKACNILTTGRTSSIDHPEVDRYARYCYREIFRQLPDLDGLYYNFESSGTALEHLVRTAVPELSAMAKPPVAVFRLWCFTDPKGMARLLSAYPGRAMVCHKVTDSNDVYYLPVADSRVRDWRKLLGMPVEWLYEMGPCHNCGTNLCSQLWSDYGYVQSLLADAVAKGADSIGFNSVNEFFSPQMDPEGKIFSAHERTMAKLNWLHLQATVDFARGVRRSAPARAKLLAQRVGVSPQAGRPLLKAIEATSQLVLLTYQQFCYGSDYDGYTNRGRYSHIQEPFHMYPATEMNNQASSPMWKYGRIGGWIDKVLDSQVVAPGELQYVIDFVNPAKRRARKNPAVIARLLQRNVEQSRRSLAEYARLAGPEAAALVEPYIRQNAAEGEFARHEILAAIALYRLYFAKTAAAVRSGLQAGLRELREASASVADPAVKKVLYRVLMLDRGPDVSPEIAGVERTLKHLEAGKFPAVAFASFMESRRQYNEIRRTILPMRNYDAQAIARFAGKPLRAALVAARRCIKQLKAAKRIDLVPNVQAWLTFVENELSRITPPLSVCASKPGQWLPLQHNHCFRRAESFTDDFWSFFEPADYLRQTQKAATVYRTGKELVVTLREQDVDTAGRLAQWKKFGNDSSCSYVMLVHLDVEGKGKHFQTVVVWPKGVQVSLDRRPGVKARTRFEHDATSWQATVWIPFALLGVKPPRKGEVWGLNVTSNPAIVFHSEYTWAAQYDCRNAKLFGKLRFE